MPKIWLFHIGEVACFSTDCAPGCLSFVHVLKIARMTSTHWPHQHFELLINKLFSSPQQCIIYYKRQSDQTQNL